MNEHRPYRRPLRSAKQRSDDYSGAVLQVVIVGLLILVALMAFSNNSKRQVAVAPDRKTALETASEQTPAPTTAEPDHSASPSSAASYPQPAQPLGPTSADISRYNSLQDYCYRMARMNANGEYPAMQRSACTDYQRFALSVGLDPGALPATREQSTADYPQPRSQPDQSAQTAQPNQWECASLEKQKEWINARTRQGLSGAQTDRYREDLRLINGRMWDLNCRNH